ncbi:MAG TPA: OmpA family protein [Gammaproteobacteria bacterium]|nr:OmpA family protein [Gammaproteobacteria bacterium]
MHARLASFFLVLVMTACATTTDPYTGEERRTRTSSGATIGAIAGAIAGIASGDDAKERRKRALIGAAGGALAGGSVGYYMDRQERELRDQLQGTGVSVSREGENIVLNMPGNITFETGSAALNASFFDVLDAVGTVLQKYDKTLVEITGHTDSTGADDFNQKLSEQRAAAVGSYLERRGVSVERMVIIGYGETRPIASNGTPAGRAENRRVEITLEPLTRD